ncbi:AAA family ATPase [Dactylosporangium sp. NPDC051541]|uniref:AAA family ATPase n=1 Tax=Dactylosporangium sp. NPDC051541 TaxID=3363977 RepID=UPI00378C4867
MRVKHYRSIVDCDVILSPLTVLLGFNASGKSNFLDALHFVADALETSPVQAAAGRGGLETLLHRSPEGAAASFELRLELSLGLPQSDDAVTATYGFKIGPDPTGEVPLLVLREAGSINLPSGTLRLPLGVHGRSSRLRLSASAIDEDAPQAVLESALRAMRFYELDSTVLRELDEKPPPRQPSLGPAGEYLGRVLGELAKDALGKERLDAYLSALVPDALGVDERREGRYSTVQARFRTGDGVETFLRESLSEGTLRAAGTLAALSQPAVLAGRVPLIGVEEPETALHPAGVNALYEALDDASTRTQVIVTSQSSDLLDSEYTRLEHIRAVANVDGVTRIGPVDAAGRSIVEKGLMSISELHRSGQMRPEWADQAPRQPGGGVGR